jgi:hypothetical protein
MQVGFTFNLKHWGTEDTSDPSDIGSSNYQTECGIVNAMKAVLRVFEAPPESGSGIPFS